MKDFAVPIRVFTEEATEITSAEKSRLLEAGNMRLQVLQELFS